MLPVELVLMLAAGVALGYFAKEMEVSIFGRLRILEAALLGAGSKVIADVETVSLDAFNGLKSDLANVIERLDALENNIGDPTDGEPAPAAEPLLNAAQTAGAEGGPAPTTTGAEGDGGIPPASSETIDPGTSGPTPPATESAAA